MDGVVGVGAWKGQVLAKGSGDDDMRMAQQLVLKGPGKVAWDLEQTQG